MTEAVQRRRDQRQRRGRKSKGALVPDIELQLDRSPPDIGALPELETRSSAESGTRVRGADKNTDAVDCGGAIVREILPVLQNTLDSCQSSRDPICRTHRRRCYVFRSIDIAEFTTLAVCPNCDIWLYVQSAVETGTTIEHILEGLLAPAARRLGDMWESDDCDFLGVTAATHRLQTVVRRLSQHCGTERQGRPKALLVAAPGETHVLGLAIVRTHFEKSGWSVDFADGGEVETAVKRRWYELVAFSISCDRFVDALAEAATRVRNASRNRKVFLLVGGPIVASDPGLAARIGADAGAATPQEAIVVTRSLLRRGARL